MCVCNNRQVFVGLSFLHSNSAFKGLCSDAWRAGPHPLAAMTGCGGGAGDAPPNSKSVIE